MRKEYQGVFFEIHTLHAIPLLDTFFWEKKKQAPKQKTKPLLYMVHFASS